MPDEPKPLSAAKLAEIETRLDLATKGPYAVLPT
jgi:hypothetical protein